MSTQDIMDLAGSPDVILTSSDGKEFPAHKEYLSTASQVFRNMFQDAVPDGEDAPRISFAEYSDIIELLVLASYPVPLEPHIPTEFDPLMEMYEAGHKYNLVRVVETASAKLRSVSWLDRSQIWSRLVCSKPRR